MGKAREAADRAGCEQTASGLVPGADFRMAEELPSSRLGHNTTFKAKTCIRWCCIDRFSWHALSSCGSHFPFISYGVFRPLAFEMAKDTSGHRYRVDDPAREA